MNTIKALLVLALLFFPLAACDRGTDPPASREAETVRGDDAPAVRSAEDDLEEIADYRLTMDAVRRYYQAQRNVFEAMREDPGLSDRLEDLDADVATLDEMQARYASVPELRDAIEEAGFTPREFSVLTWSLVQASIAQGAVEMGVSRDSVVANTGVRRANLDFVQEHQAEIERMQRELEALAPDDAYGEDDYGDEE